MDIENDRQQNNGHPGATKTVPKTKPKKTKPKSKAVAIHKPAHKPAPPAAPPPGNFLQVIVTAVSDPRCDVEKMKALLDMQERIEEREAKKAFTVAFNAMQAQLPVINRDGKIDHSSDGGDTTRGGKKALKTTYATYPNLNRVCGPLMKQHGFTFSSAMEPNPNGSRELVSTLEHVGGASRSTSFTITADATGGKNNQQGWGSSQQYAMRYNMIALLNIVSEAKQDADNDGFNQAEAATITQSQVRELVKLCEETKTDQEKFCGLLGVESIAAIPPAQFAEAKGALNMKKRAQRASDFPGDR